MNDRDRRIESLTEDKRATLSRLLTRVAESRASSIRADEAGTRPTEQPLRDDYDIAIMGGGLSGLTLSIQLRRACPDATILIVNRNKYPAPEAAHKVGESSVEIGARYYDSVLGFKEHLEERQLRKMGLRFFSPSGDNNDLASRTELGPFKNHLLPIPSYQIDRGRFENMLAVQAAKEGVAFFDECRVEQVALSENGRTYLIELDHDGKRRRVRARWLIDASGRGDSPAQAGAYQALRARRQCRLVTNQDADRRREVLR